MVTSDDYFKFINSESYFSQKLSTILHENTVVILGYSLGDTNLKTILSNYKGFSKTNVISGSIFFVSRSPVDQYIKDYYAHSFSIRVIDNTEIHEFFRQVRYVSPAAASCVNTSKDSIKKVLYENHLFTDDHLKIDQTFFEILSAIAAIGAGLNSPEVVKLLGAIIDKKLTFINEYGAWNQYTQLARWLVYLASLVDIQGTEMQEAFLRAALRSMDTMSKANELGKSWHAYHSWSAGWSSVTPNNRILMRTYITANSQRADARELVSRP